jgi:hypothetical protein
MPKLLSSTIAMALSLAGSARAQLKDGPGNGVSKTTFSANDPLSALEFNLKYFPVTDADDSCTNDVCTCTVSGSNYEVQQGRVQLETSALAAPRELLDERAARRHVDECGRGRVHVQARRYELVRRVYGL